MRKHLGLPALAMIAGAFLMDRPETASPVRTRSASVSKTEQILPAQPGMETRIPADSVFEFVDVGMDVPEETAALRSLPVPVATRTGTPCRILLHRRGGRVLRPDYRRAVLFDLGPGEEAPAEVEGGGAGSTAGGEIAFTFDSPDNPWTSEEVATLQSWVATLYPLLKQAPECGATESYTMSAIDPEDDPVRYYVDWGDGTTTTTDLLTGVVVLSHTWEGGGLCRVRVRALDATGLASPWSDVLPVNSVEPPPSTPSKPSGPTEVNPDTPATYESASSDPYGQEVQLIFDWGDGSSTESGFSPPMTIGMAHQWNAMGTYMVRVRARDTKGAYSDWSDPLAVSVVPNVPPETPVIVSGTMAGDPGQELKILVKGTDPYQQPYDYVVDWGDGTMTTAQRTALYTSIGHVWALPGTYYVRVQAKDIGGLSSPWSGSVAVGIRRICFVKSISFTTAKTGKTWYLTTRVDVQDAFGKPVSYAKVYGKLTLPSGTVLSATGTTNSYGYVTFKYGASVLPAGSYTFTVTQITHATLTYLASKNLETSDTFVKP